MISIADLSPFVYTLIKFAFEKSTVGYLGGKQCSTEPTG